MNDNAIETDPIKITDDDIKEANQLSLHCPICAGAVENYATTEALTPVYCGNCETLYHKACWEQMGGACAVLGCDHKEYRVYGANQGPILVITDRDLPKTGTTRIPTNRTKEIKREEQRRRAAEQRSSFWRMLFQRLLRAIKILD